MERYLRYDLYNKFVVNNPILLWGSFCNHLCCNFSLLYVYLNEKKKNYGRRIMKEDYEREYRFIDENNYGQNVALKRHNYIVMLLKFDD